MKILVAARYILTLLGFAFIKGACAGPLHKLESTTAVIVAEVGQETTITWTTTKELTYAYIRIGKYRSNKDIGYFCLKKADSKEFYPDGNMTLRMEDLYENFDVAFDDKKLNLRIKSTQLSDAGHYQAEVRWGLSLPFYTSNVTLDVKHSCCGYSNNEGCVLWKISTGILSFFALAEGVIIAKNILRFNRRGSYHTVLGWNNNDGERFIELTDLNTTGQEGLRKVGNKRRRQRGNRFKTV